MKQKKTEKMKEGIETDGCLTLCTDDLKKNKKNKKINLVYLKYKKLTPTTVSNQGHSGVPDERSRSSNIPSDCVPESILRLDEALFIVVLDRALLATML